MDRVRTRGYAINDEEAIEGLWAVSKAVKDQLGRVCGSLNVCGPTYICTDERKQTIVDQLEAQVARFEQEIADKA